MKAYDPNVSWAVNTVEITYQQWDYTATVQVKLQGNCKGFDVLDGAIFSHSQDIYEQQGEEAVLILRRAAADGDGEDTLETSPDGEDLERWLTEMCVGVKIIEVVPFERGGAS